MEKKGLRDQLEAQAREIQRLQGEPGSLLLRARVPRAIHFQAWLDALLLWHGLPHGQSAQQPALGPRCELPHEALLSTARCTRLARLSACLPA